MKHDPELIRAAAALGDGLAKVRPQAVFFDEIAAEAIAGKSDDEALTILSSLIDEAEADKRAGYGPPTETINIVRRRWLDIYARLYGRAA